LALPLRLVIGKPGRDRRLQFLQFSLQKMVGDDQRLDGLASIPAAGRDGLIGGGL
jgi:hypothetical protein